MTRTYLHTLPYPEALARWLPGLRAPLESERVRSEDALGRTTAEAVFARVSSPHYHGAAMDGIAVASNRLAGASEAHPRRLREGDDYAVVDTGDALPAWADAVIMSEELRAPAAAAGIRAGAAIAPNSEVEIVRAPSPREHVRLAGEDIVAGELVLPRGHRIRAWDVGALLASGNVDVACARRPRVGIVATGDELVEPGAPLAPGQIVEFNSRMLAAAVREAGGEPVRYPPARDDLDAVRGALGRVLAECDVALAIAGSSKGRGDHTPDAIAALGELRVHGVQIMPGKPVALGMSPDGRAILGVPGYPVSAAVVADLFLRPLLARLLGEAPRARERVRARTTRAIPSRLGLEEFIRVSLGRVGGRVGDRLLAAPLARGAGAITTLTRAQGYLRIAENLEGVEAGAEVEVELLVPREEVEETLLHVGSHDPALDVLGDLLRARRPAARLASSPVGSIGGILAAAEGTCHFAGSHLLDPESGTYNLPYLDRLAPGADLAVVTLAHRTQGLVVARGNPLGLRGVEDLARARFVNRQRGSGTRILLDHLLGRASVDPGAIRGYAHEEFTHMAVASAVATGAADTGLAVLAATRALGLDFVPLGEERYDLVLPRAQLDDPRVQHLIDTMVSSDFRAALARLGGYDVRENGKRWR